LYNSAAESQIEIRSLDKYSHEKRGWRLNLWLQQLRPEVNAENLEYFKLICDALVQTFLLNAKTTVGKLIALSQVVPKTKVTTTPSTNVETKSDDGLSD
jgi:hypothetical protein